MDVATSAASPTPEGGYVLLDITERIVSISSGQPRESFKRVFSDVGHHRTCGSACPVRW
jgi:hypothetical protein